MTYTLSDIAAILQLQINLPGKTEPIRSLLTDSRRLVFPSSTLFFALHTATRDGHSFISDLYNRGVRNFVVNHQFNTAPYKNAGFIFCPDPLQVLQHLCAYHRSQFTYPLIAITGSNGKTIVKEWLNQLLTTDHKIVRSPRSYNSQTGVPLSVWQMDESYDLAIFEAGISTSGEMHNLEKILLPTIGVLTNIGEAHNEGFENLEQKITEKLLLFKGAKVIICNADNEAVMDYLNNFSAEVFSWSVYGNGKVDIFIERLLSGTNIHVNHNNVSFIVNTEFTDEASVQNCITSICVMLYMEYDGAIITERLMQLQPVNMRMQLVPGINNCSVINDSYSFDIHSLSIALDFLQQQHQHPEKTVILSDIPGTVNKEAYELVASMLQARQINRVITVGELWTLYKDVHDDAAYSLELFNTTGSFIKNFSGNNFRNEAVLLKAGRVFRFEKIASLMQKKVHQTGLEIDLNALSFNLKFYRQHLKPGVKVMAMVKAFGYGTGAGVANLLQFHKVNYLAVAYTDEGVELRRAGIRLPILVLNVDEAAFETLVQYNLEPELYSLKILLAFDDFLNEQGLMEYPVHIKLDTGLHRLGFEQNSLSELGRILTSGNRMVVVTVFSHFAASGNKEQASFTLQQVNTFNAWCITIEQLLGYKFLKHISNTAAILNYPEYQFDMVRLGIGLYGVESSGTHQHELKTAATLKTTIAQIRTVKAGETIGYNRRGIVNKDAVIATLRIGYADGLPRFLGNGAGRVFLKNSFAPIIGDIAMDMCMIDITRVPNVREDDEVEIFGEHIPVTELAESCKTIPYEILTGISQRVKRIYIEE